MSNWQIGEPNPQLGLFLIELYQRGSDIFRVIYFDDANQMVDVNNGEEIKNTAAQHLRIPENRPQ